MTSSTLRVKAITLDDEALSRIIHGLCLHDLNPSTLPLALLYTLNTSTYIPKRSSIYTTRPRMMAGNENQKLYSLHIGHLISLTALDRSNPLSYELSPMDQRVRLLVREHSHFGGLGWLFERSSCHP